MKWTKEDNNKSKEEPTHERSDLNTWTIMEFQRGLINMAMT